MGEKIEMLSSELEAMKGELETLQTKIDDSKASKLVIQRKLQQELIAQVPLPPSQTLQTAEQAPASATKDTAVDPTTIGRPSPPPP